MMFKALVVLALLATCYAQSHDDPIDDIVKDVFGEAAPPSSSDPGSSSEIPCNEKIAKCVHYYLCDYQYKADDKKFAELVESAAGSYCPSYLDTCCLLEAILDFIPPK